MKKALLTTTLISTLTFIPEVRLDNGSKNMFTDHEGAGTRSASQFALAAVYPF